MTSCQYQLHNAAVQDVIDGEAVIIQLETGNYFSLDAWGAWIWQCLLDGMSSETICHALEARFPDQKPRAAVQQLLDALLDAHLLTHKASAPEPAGLCIPDALPYATPQLQTYTDMQDLLLLDPIHEVDQRGWPHASDSDAA